MPQFVYFIENETVGSQALYESCGLAYALRGAASVRNAANGPGGQPGVVVARDANQLGYFPDKQTWRAIGERSGRKVWLGYATDQLPLPDDLRTSHALRGHSVKLFDDREWVVPVAIQFVDGEPLPGLPAALEVDERGELRRGAVKECYARLWEIATQHWDNRGERGYSVQDATKLAVEVLQVNYRISLHEAATLRLFESTGEVALSVLEAAIDMPTVLAWASKKKEPEPSGA